jgi:hypothetical protein
MTDETDFNLIVATNPQNDRVWAEGPDDVPPMELVGRIIGIKVWGGVSGWGTVPLQAYKGNINQEKYLKILKNMRSHALRLMKPNWYFQHDGASAHKARSVNKWLTNQVPNHITSGPYGDWPANSPDLNWTENVWAIVKSHLEKNPPTTTNALKVRVKKIWKEFDPELLKRMAGGMRQRLRDVIKKKGGCIGK